MRLYIWQILTLSLNVIRENMRNRAFLILSLSGLFLFVVSQILGTMAVGGPGRVIQDTGFWIMGIWGLLTSVFLGSNIIKQELMNKTAYLLLSRPLSRTIFVLGKFFGIVSLMLILFMILSTAFMLQLVMMGNLLTSQVFIALFFIFSEWLILASFSICFATFTSPLLHGFFLTGLYFLGHWSNSLYRYSENMDDLVIKKLLIVVYNIFPNLEALNYRPFALYNDAVTAVLMTKSFLVALFWSVSALLVSIMVFKKRKLL